MPHPRRAGHRPRLETDPPPPRRRHSARPRLAVHGAVRRQGAEAGIALYETHRGRVATHKRIRRQQGDPLDDRLSDQHPIERVPVNRWEIADRNSVLARDRKLVIAVIEQSPAQQSRLDLEIVAAEAALDRNLPKAGGTEQQVGISIRDQRARFLGQPLRFSSRPQQEMSIEQKLHRPPPNSSSISSAPMRSKSSGTAICPAMKPSRLA